ncbi:hypothetical protein SAMN05443667_1209 [Flavobacterium gillisiae]|uniref:Uncharacterized protein n=1 Tax=Flavobacterium gillisiae TaxID=150146 RepID=A0A1H4GDJ3_9FLAO|nr:hypothetical protein [Flavobacterium gillisiae]SEB06978.1 hypothetical protein SAMN05443667_1209 [Flavobacterium gillisiae]
MTAALAYQIIQTLSDSERDALFDKLRPELKVFSLDELLSEEDQESIDRQERIEYLLSTQFRKVKKLKYS